MNTVNVKWIESHLMIGADSNGHSIVLCKSQERHPIWQGVNPADLLLLAAASCSLYDVVDILQKQHEPLENIEVACSGEKQSEPVNSFSDIHFHYKVKGNVETKKVERAIQLSFEKYCTVINTFKECVKVSFDFEIIPT